MLLCVPNMSAEHPESHGIEQQPREEEHKIEAGVHLVHTLLPAGHIVATW